MPAKAERASSGSEEPQFCICLEGSEVAGRIVAQGSPLTSWEHLVSGASAPSRADWRLPRPNRNLSIQKPDEGSSMDMNQ